jgi:hypothetical protein
LWFKCKVCKSQTTKHDFKHLHHFVVVTKIIIIWNIKQNRNINWSNHFEKLRATDKLITISFYLDMK